MKQLLFLFIGLFLLVSSSMADVTTSKPSYKEGETIVVNYTSSTAAKDWIGIYSSTATPGSVSSIDWVYCNTGTTSSGSNIKAEGSVSFTTKLSAGSYIIFMCADDGYTVMSQVEFTIDLPTPKDNLSTKITAATNLYDNTEEGIDPGKFTATPRTTFKSAIEAAQAVYDAQGKTDDDFTKALDELNTAQVTYLNSVILPVISTNTANTKWYFLQGTRPSNTYLTSMGTGENLKSITVIPDDTQLWKLVPNTNGNGFALVNKVTGEYMKTDDEYVSSGITLATQNTMPANNLRFIPSDIITNKTIRFWIENEEGSTPEFRLHAGNTNILNWTGDAYDNSSWLFLDYTGGLKQALSSKINEAKDLIENTTGDDFGKRSSDNAQDLKEGITISEEIIKTSTDPNDYNFAINGLTQLIKNFRKIIPNTDLEILISSKTDNYKWYWIRNYATSASYCYGKVMSAGTRTVGEKYTYENKNSTPSDNQLFRFELNDDKSKVRNIINKQGNYLAADGAIATSPTEGNEFEITLLEDSIGFWIKPTNLDPIHAARSGAEILNWNSAAGSASAWVFDFAMEATVSAVNEHNNSNIKASLCNNKLKITNAERSIIILNDVSGKTIMTSKVNWPEQEFDAPHDKGIYFVTIRRNGETPFTLKVVK